MVVLPRPSSGSGSSDCSPRMLAICELGHTDLCGRLRSVLHDVCDGFLDDAVDCHLL